MSKGIIGSFKMYDENFTFLKPDDSKTYNWPTEDFKVKDWNTWTRAFAYWLRDGLGFEIFSGPGTTMGKVGRLSVDRYTYDDEDNPYLSRIESAYWDSQGNLHFQLPDNFLKQNDNDWTSDNYGLYDLENEDWELYRAPSPFRPQIIKGNKYYTDGTIVDGKLKWTGKWLGSEIFDDTNNRFDINIQNSNFNNLGIRIKYPLTFTTTRCAKSLTQQGDTSYTQRTGIGNADTSSMISIIPCISLTNKENNIINQIIIQEECNSKNQKFWGSLGFITPLLKITDYFNFFLIERFCGVYHGNDTYARYWNDSGNLSEKTAIKKDGTIIINGNISDTPPSNCNYKSGISVGGSNIYTKSLGIEPYGWTPETLDNLNSIIRDNLFNPMGIGYNTVKYYQSCDNDVLYITICKETNEKGVELLFYKNEDDTSGCLISEGFVQSRNSSYAWQDEGEKKNWIVNKTSHPYGNIGGLVVSSSDSSEFSHYIVTPSKYYIDVRDSNSSLVDATGYWRLEKFCPMPNSGTHCKNLYLVTRCGTSDIIPPEGKRITCKINDKKINFLVFPFNNSSLGENNFNDTSTLFAIPIEREE